MLRQLPTRCFKRFYQHDSSFRHDKQAPVVKLASKRVGDILRRRVDREVSPQIKNYGPKKTFEPFPLKVVEENKAEVLRTYRSPLHEIDYHEQLKSKESICKNALRMLAKELQSIQTPVRVNVQRLPCVVQPIVGSPELLNYVNKDEYGIWYGTDRASLTVGHRVFPIAKHGDTVCVEPNDCLITRVGIHPMTDILQDFIRNHAKLPVCFDLGTQGGWRRFSIRINYNDEIMLTGVINPRLLKNQEISDERENFKKFVVEQAEQKEVKLTSLFTQLCPNNRCTHEVAPYQLLHGRETMIEKLNGLDFMISPDTLMPHNKGGAEELYNAVRKTIQDCFMTDSESLVMEKPLIIDLICGSGILALQLADLGSKIIGIDSSDLSVNNAIKNAELNNISNAMFYKLIPEYGLGRVLEKHSKYKHDTLVICTLPRSGMRSSIVEALRNFKDISKVILIAPRIESTPNIECMIKLCKVSRDFSGDPFVPVSATPVDIAPHVDRFESIIAFERRNVRSNKR